MGGAVEGYNIDMPETEHLDHLLPALHLLRPPMRIFQDNHCTYKFQVDPSVVTQPPVTLTFVGLN